MIFQVLDVLGVMKFQQLFFSGMAALINIHLFVEVEALDEGVGHSYSPWFHGMFLVVVEFADFIVVEICHFFVIHSDLK